MVTIGGDGSKTGLVMKKKGNKNGRPVSVPASSRTTARKGGEQHDALFSISIQLYKAPMSLSELF